MISDERYSVKGMLDYGIRFKKIPDRYLVKHQQSGQYVVLQGRKIVLLMTDNLNQAILFFLSGINDDKVSPMPERNHKSSKSSKSRKNII